MIQYGIPGEVSVNPINTRIPDEHMLHQNYPNPFNPATTIRFNLPKSDFTTIKIYNLAGQEVETLHTGFLDAGEHHVVWHPDNLSGGVYFYQLQSGKFRETKKLIFQK